MKRKKSKQIIERPIETSHVFNKAKVVGCSRLNLRSAPNSNGTIIAVIDSSTEITTDASKIIDGYIGITIDATGMFGYCLDKYIEFVE